MTTYHAGKGNQQMFVDHNPKGNKHRSIDGMGWARRAGRLAKEIAEHKKWGR